MSVPGGIIEYVFEEVTDAELVDNMGEETREESAAMARRLSAIGELFERRARELQEAELWFTDPREATAAEVSAAMNISRARALSQIHYAWTLRERLPAVAKVFCKGLIDFRMILAIIARTENVDDEVMARLDEALARHVERWMRLSGPKLYDRLDLWVTKFDPAGVRIPPTVGEGRFVQIEATTPGMASIWAGVHASDAAALDQRLDAMAATVCDNDPRTTEQRRADACGALARSQERLDCQCGSQQCPAAVQREAVHDVVIHVLAEQATIDGTANHPGYLSGFGILPAESVRELAKSATLKPLAVPSGPSEAGYRPSKGLAEFVRWRDLTCRWPGCDRPAARCDLDHTVAWPLGPTHPSNLKPYCRTHHLIKTFYGGQGGWTDHQLPDGRIIFTAPTGHTYVTEPHGATLFPALGQLTGELDVGAAAGIPDANRAVMMPKRKQTREQDRLDRIANERRERTELIAEEERQRQAWLAATYEPPPF